MRTKIISAVAGLAVFASTASPALAQGLGASVRASIKDLRAQFHADVKAEREEARIQVKASASAQAQLHKEKAADKRKERIKQWATQAARRLNKLIDRLTKTGDKIEARINVLAGAGKDVTKLRTDLAAARAKITDARNALNTMSAQVDVIISSNSPKDAFKKLHELERGVTAKIRAAQQALVKLLKDTKGLRVGASVSVSVSPSPSASVTPTSTPTPTATPTVTPTPTATP